MKKFRDDISNSSKEGLKSYKDNKQYNEDKLNQTCDQLKKYVNFLKKKTLFDLDENEEKNLFFPKQLVRKNSTYEERNKPRLLKQIKEVLKKNNNFNKRSMSHHSRKNNFNFSNYYDKKENNKIEENNNRIEFKKNTCNTFSYQKSLELPIQNFHKNRKKIQTYEKKMCKKNSSKMVKKTKKALINHHLSEKQLLEKKIESKKYLLKIKDNFSILKQPKIFEGEYDSNTYENISNDKFIELSNMNNKGIIQLNELKKELKDSLIGKSDIHEIHSFKSFLSDDNNNEDLNNEIIDEKEKYRILTRKGYVYDSFDDEEIIDEINYNYIHPNSIIVRVIDFFVFVFTFYNLFYIPLFLGKKDIYCVIYNVFYFQYLFNNFIDVTYIIDFIISFFVAYYDFDEKLVFEYNLIVKHYLRTWFLIDLLSAIPLQTIFTIFNNKCKNIGFLIHPLFSKNFYYLWILLRLLKTIKVISKNKFLEKVSDELSKFKIFNRYLKLLISLFTFFISLHLVSCIFIFIGKNDYPNWIIHFNHNYKDFYELYLISIYYTIETLTTVGYGDITCISSSEKIYGLFMEVIGICAYSWALTEISNYIKVLNEKSEDLNNKIQILDDIKLNYPYFPDNLYDRILRYLKYKHLYEKKDINCIINDLPNQLRNSLFYEMYKPVIKNFYFFRNFSNIDFIVNILLSFKPVLAIKNDILIKDGDLIEDIIFVKKGKLTLEIPFIEEIKKKKQNSLTKKSISFINNKTREELNHNNLNTFFDTKTINNKFTFLKTVKKEEKENIQYFRILEIRRNEYFGDVLIFFDEKSPLRLRVKSKKAELFYLNKENVIKISSSYPQYWKKINKKSLFNLQQIKRLINRITKIMINEHGFIPKYHDNLNNTDFKNLAVIKEDDLKTIPSISSSFQKSDVDQIKEEESEESKKNDENIIYKKENIKDHLNKDIHLVEQNNNKILKDNLSSSSCNTFDNKNAQNDNYKSNLINKTSNSNKSLKNSTPYEYDEINDEIYPEETFRIKPKLNPNYNFKNYIQKKNLNNISVCSTEISFCIQSDYENIDELSHHNYKKDIKFRNKVNDFIKEEINKKNNSNFKINIIQAKENNNINHNTVNNNNNNNNNNKNNNNNINHYNTVNNNNNNKNNNNNNISNDVNKNNNNNINISNDINNNNNKLLNNTFKSEFKNSLIQNINENTNILGVNQFIPLSSRTRKSIISGRKSISSARKSIAPGRRRTLEVRLNSNNKEDDSSKNNLLSIISQKIEINNMNLNNPELFYSQIFMKFMDDEIPQNEDIDKEKDNNS